MAVTSNTGTQTATINTEHTLYGANTAGVYQAWIDLSNLAAGDAVELRVYKILKTGGTPKVVHYVYIAGAQPADDAVARTEGFTNGLTDTNSLQFTLKQLYGTGRAFDWCVDKVA
jgi:hypothetical protein